MTFFGIFLCLFENEDKNTRRDCILRCLSVYLNEDIKTLVKEYVDSESVEAESLIAQTTMGIYVIWAEGAGPEEEPSDVGVVLEGVEVLQNLPSVTLGCVMLFGLIDALNLNYPKDLKCTFEAFQKILMELDTTKLSPKVQGLKIKMLQWIIERCADIYIFPLDLHFFYSWEPPPYFSKLLHFTDLWKCLCNVNKCCHWIRFDLIVTSTSSFAVFLSTVLEEKVLCLQSVKILCIYLL